MAARTLTVMVEGWVIEDGALAVPVVGQTPPRPVPRFKDPPRIHPARGRAADPEY